MPHSVERAAERASTGRATCRQCKTLIPKGTWRLALAFYDTEAALS